MKTTTNGLFVIISSPSGGGKNSVIEALLPRVSCATRLVTTTSRPPRPGDRPGVDYHFISKTAFEEGMRGGHFLEYNFYAGHYYGTQKGTLDALLHTHDVVFSQIEVNGKHALDRAGIANLSIFLVPESLDILEARIRKRGGLGADDIERRLAQARVELEESSDYDYRIVNKEGKMEETVDAIADIITSRISSHLST